MQVVVKTTHSGWMSARSRSIKEIADDEMENMTPHFIKFDTDTVAKSSVFFVSKSLQRRVQKNG